MRQAGRRGNNEGSIRQRADGLWEARLSIEGRQRSVYAKTRADVVTRMRQAQRLAEKGLPQAQETVTVGQFLANWLESSVRPSVRASTYSAYESHVRLHLTPSIGRVRLVKLQPERVQTLMIDLMRAGLSATSALRVRATLRRALNVALRWGLVHRNVATLIDPPKATRYKVAAMSPEEAAAILRAVEAHRWGAMYGLILAVGLRSGEARALRWADVDWDGRTISVRHTLTRLDGEWVLTPPKSERSMRTLPLPQFAVDMLSEHQALESGDDGGAAAAANPLGLIFTSAAGTPIDASNAVNEFKRTLAFAGLPARRLHDLRHGCASLLLSRGVSPRVVMETLGHSQISLTMDTYSHVLPSLQRDAADQMQEALHLGRASAVGAAEPT